MYDMRLVLKFIKVERTDLCTYVYTHHAKTAYVHLHIYLSICITSYRSKMVGFLAFPLLEQVPETFEQLVQSKYQVGFSKHC